MSYARARAKKHYRAVQKQIENSPSKSILIPKKNKNKNKYHRQKKPEDIYKFIRRSCRWQRQSLSMR